MDYIKPRILPSLCCLISVLLCLAYARFRNELPEWWRLNGGGIPYVLFWIFLWFTAFPKPKWILPICVSVTLFTCGLEILQLWSPEPLAQFRRTRFGAALMGSTFVWEDFPPYFIGGLIGYAVTHAISRLSFNGKNADHS